MTVREICKARHITTLDEQDELLVRLASDRAALLSALKEILAHVEDMDLERFPPNQCTLCHTFRMIGHDAIAQAEASR